MQLSRHNSSKPQKSAGHAAVQLSRHNSFKSQKSAGHAASFENGGFKDASAAHGGVVTTTRPVAFSGRLRGVLAGARGTWAGVVLGHKTAVLEVMPQVGQPRCGIVSKSTVDSYL